jgi:very-short-patch-repair endonuclease
MPNQNRERARDLRRRQTEQEQFVWRRLRNRRFSDFKFRRQFPLGNYFVDFVCLERRLILELDGGQHGESVQTRYDVARDAWLRSQGFWILRFWNHQVIPE